MLRIKSMIYKHKLLAIVLAALLTTAALTALANLTSLTWLTGEALNNVVISERDGIYDLTGITSFDKTVIRLAPSTVYYPNTYLTSTNADDVVPESVDNLEKIRAEYLSQRFVLKLPDTSDTYALTFTLSGRHAMRVIVNGRFAAQTGQPGTTKQDTEVWENNITFHAAAVNGDMDIILHSAHFYHAKRGASLAELSLSKGGTVPDPFFFGRIKGIVIMGAFLCASVLLLGIYLMLSRTRETLYFALACLVMALRECLQSQAWIYFPIPGNLSFMLEYLSMVLLSVFLALYLGQYATGKFLRGIQYTAILGSCLYGVCVLFGDSIFYTSGLIVYQILLVMCIALGIAGLFWKMRNSINKEQAVAMFGIAVFFLAALSDIMMYSELFGARDNTPISEIAMLVFVLAQSVSLFQMNNRVLGEAKKMEQKLEAENTALESLNRMKTEFLGDVSHELKTPLTVVSGYAQITKQLAERPDTLDSSEVSRRMTLISSEAERLSLMVGQILDVTRMEEGRMVMEPVRCYTDEIIHAAIETHYPILNKNRNRLDIRIERGLPAIDADPARISQVIVNLVSNAVRFTADGVITISAKKNNDNILICVSDTGVGIAAERLPHIFERYSKKQKSGGGQDTGTGLGLYICKHIVEQHGGEIWIESKEGHGTHLFFTLPVRDG
ncbi:HAMP domain-containing sensor histidine kinase [Anoxynatronum buryatiense]|uniref:histidine kinase n=1 Tax=Anoxynatronum buryatiense TaxID=489973 RepID=A0AA45WY10_9CLOT|nr:sensor histidine kinase [Anoxynatronum buryatiense]SMP66586.1 Signal transduction histidine kinase [Anoxynatronum buryatiense]